MKLEVCELLSLALQLLVQVPFLTISTRTKSSRVNFFTARVAFSRVFKDDRHSPVDGEIKPFAFLRLSGRFGFNAKRHESSII